MASWKKVIVSGSNAHLTSVTASQVPQILDANAGGRVLAYDVNTGAFGYINTSSIVTAAASSVTSFSTINVGGLGGSSGTAQADSSTDTLIISSSDANLTISASAGNDTITFNFADSPSFTNITASGNISSSAGLIGSTLTTSGGATVGGDLAVNRSGGARITTNVAATAEIFNTTATQIDLGGAATIVNIGGDFTQTNLNGSVQLGNGSGDLITLGGDSDDIVGVSGRFQLGDGLLNSNLIPFSNNANVIGSSSREIKSIVVNQITSSGNISSSAGLIGATLTTSGIATIGGRLTTTTLTASATPEITSASLSGYHIALVGSGGELVKVATLPSGNVAGINSFSNITIGGVTVTADSSADTLTINSGSFAGSANTNNNLLISASQDDVITFSFNDSPTFTQITASGNISGSGNLSITGTSTLTGRLSASGAITTTNITASGNISSSAGLIGATLNTSGSATIGGTLDVTGTTTLAGNLLANGNTTLGDAAGDTVTVNAQSVTLQNPLNSTANVNSILVVTSSNRIATQSIDSRVWGTTLVDNNGTSFTATRVPYATDGNSLIDSANLTFASNILTVNGSTFGQDVTIAGNLTVNGDTTIINTTNISIEDKFILLASGSGSTTDGGIIVQTTSGSSGVSTGSALFYNGTGVPANGSARWGLNNNVVHTSDTVTPTDYLVSVSASGENPLNTAAGAPTYGSASAGFGNVHINTSNNTIWMYI